MSVMKIEDIAFMRYAAPDLAKMRQFLEDFGLTYVEGSRDDVLWMRGLGTAPFLHETVLGEPAFGGFGLRAGSVEDLRKLAAHDGVAVEQLDAPGGGYVVRLRDPDGFAVDVVAEQAPAATLDEAEQDGWNDSFTRRRLSKVRHALPGEPTKGRPAEPIPAKVVRLGHGVFEVSDLQTSEQWWKSRFGLITSDEIAVPGGPTIGMFMRCDRGAELTDHHTLTMFQAEERGPGVHHMAFEVRDIDDLMHGHAYLKAQGRDAGWGVGRHIVGSQVFDYWRDPWGNRVEHWTDGDVFTAADGSNVVGPEMLDNRWGPPLPANF